MEFFCALNYDFKNRCRHEAAYNYNKLTSQLTFKQLREKIVLRFDLMKKPAHRVQAPNARNQRDDDRPTPDGKRKRDDDNKQSNCYFCNNSSEHKYVQRTSPKGNKYYTGIKT